MDLKIKFIDLNNYQEEKLIEGVLLHPLKRARRGEDDPRGYLVEMFRSDWLDLSYDSHPASMTYSSFTYKGIARDEDQFHVHPKKDQAGGIEQIDRWTFIGKAVALVANPETGEINLFKVGTGWGDSGFYVLFIPPRMYHGFLSVGGVLDDEGKEGVWILNWPDNLYDYENPSLIEGRVPYQGSGLKLPNGNEFNWDDIRDILGITHG